MQSLKISTGCEFVRKTNVLLHGKKMPYYITEDNAKEIYEYSKSKNLRVITTEKDHVKLKDSKENSYRERLYLSSIIAKVRIRLDNKILINFLRDRKLIK